MISVCMATYNGGRFLKEQLSSILSQLGEDDEVIISDDGSTDNTLDVARSFHSPIVHIMVNEGEHGYTPNFENALRHAHGDYIFLSDQDDVWEPDKVGVCMDLFKDCDLIISDATLIDENGAKIGDSFYAQRHSRPGLLNNLIRFSFLGCCMAFRRNVLQLALPFPKNHRYCTHDNWLTLVGMAFFRALAVDDKLIRYRRYGSNTSTGGFHGSTSFGFKLAYRLYLVLALLRRSLRRISAARHRAVEDDKTVSHQ